ncbi:MAG TPA: hypothetical protein VFO03_05640 [Gaiellaceae bacterium]|nr:hypothetical protein [Gaiellaceae bacterium]
MIDDYLARLSDELIHRGVGARDRDRILAEAADHLRELADRHGEEDAIARFGEARPLAVELAAQLATTKTIRSTYATFAGLGVTALALLALLVYADDRAPNDVLAGKHAAAGLLASLGLLLLPQVAFVSGGLALLRALRRRGQGALPCEELDVLGRRSAVALAAGGLTAVSMLVWGYEFGHFVPVLVLAVVAVAPLCVVLPALASASSPQAPSAGRADDVFDDLHLGRLRARPWLFAFAVALSAGVIALAVDGIVLAGLELTAVLVCFAWLGRPLALRS